MISQDKDAEFSTLFEEFVCDYLSLPQGQAHLSRYEAVRVQGRENFNKVTAAAIRSEEITDLVLRLLLPYTDSAAHRASAVWIHIAPAIQGDVKEWFQSAGWTKPEDWRFQEQNTGTFGTEIKGTPSRHASRRSSTRESTAKCSSAGTTRSTVTAGSP